MTQKDARTLGTALVVVAAIMSITFIEGLALATGVDGAFFGLAIAGVTSLAAGYAGFRIRDFWRR